MSLRDTRKATFTRMASVIFLLIALGHLSRLVFKWSLSLEAWQVPLWVNVPLTLMVALCVSLDENWMTMGFFRSSQRDAIDPQDQDRTLELGQDGSSENFGLINNRNSHLP